MANIRTWWTSMLGMGLALTLVFLSVLTAVIWFLPVDVRPGRFDVWFNAACVGFGLSGAYMNAPMLAHLYRGLGR